MFLKRPKLIQVNLNPVQLRSIQKRTKLTNISELSVISEDPDSSSELQMELSFQIESKEFYNAVINASFTAVKKEKKTFARIKQLTKEAEEIALRVEGLEKMLKLTEKQVLVFRL
ncbi:Hypothetical_protein [Hexamita inflata]|uniref:Hypothetical_protein n=1 Tax=Hexamita inflata TaxID=28002 RepID=A0AA86U1D7_9EUKA|nr:Hypothetical protein HINF_LOCUS24239 [Hexamita inflata]CAI9950348.1 Hypothetical protein HINF_LOCUS37993 [Hexamita inflata]CAI9964291.1 Hypothetical protein HINF_LOCUS51936 [Hexamita inflata]